MSQFQSVNVNSLRNDNDPPPISCLLYPTDLSKLKQFFWVGGNLRNTTADYAAFTASVVMTTDGLFSENKKLGICSTTY